VLSGRTNDEVKADPERVWRSDLPASEASVAVRPATRPPGTEPRVTGSARTRPRSPRTASTKSASKEPGSKEPGSKEPGRDELSQLDTLGSAGSLDVFGHRLRLTNLDKVLFPARPGEAPVTKRELIRYAIQIAPVILPYLAGRPLNMHRFPGGAGTAGFWQKRLPEHAPDWIGRWDNPEADQGKVTTYLGVNEPAAHRH
jgi:bifunctional non-homologous end joining protein LigD